MVNIPLLTMDDYGLLEPTDVGTMTIGFDPKEEFKRRINRWDQEEVVCMLNLIKENSFLTRYSVTKMSCMLSQLMLKKGYSRTERQIHLKLTTLRKNYLACERQKLVNGNLKECPFYKELRDVYRDTNSTNGIDSEDYDTSSQDECLIKFPSDPFDWTKGEVQKMLNIIKSMKLKNELTLTFFSPVAVKMIAEALQNAGFDRSTEQVKNALINLRSMYIDYKIGFDNNEHPSECMFYPCLDLFWGREYKKCRLKERRRRSDDSWSTDEIIVLLTLIQDLNIAEDAYNNCEKAAENLKYSLAENGYSRTAQQIQCKLQQLKTDFIDVHSTYGEADAVLKFPFYTLYKKLFHRQFNEDVGNELNSLSDLQKTSLEYMNFCDKKKQAPPNQNTTWSRDEVKLLLKTVQDITSGSHSNDSLEDEKLQRLVRVLSESGFHKTAEQIKKKLALLKSLYLKCNLEDSSEKDIFECPFYNELHGIFHTPVSDERYEFIQNLLTENVDLSTSKCTDHSYTNNVKFGISSSENRVNDKVTVVPNKCIDTWFPVESIIDEDGIGASSTLDFNNLSGVSTKEQEQVIEDALLAALPNHCGTRIEENNQSIPETTNIVPEERVPSIINDVAIDQEVVATNEETEVDYSKIYRYDGNLDLERQLAESTLMTESLIAAEKQPTPEIFPSGQKRILGEDDGISAIKKPKINEDDKVPGKNKFLLRPVEDMNPSSLNITNTKFVRLIVSNDPNKNRVNHITAHIEPMNINTTNSVSSGMSSPCERVDILKMATEKIFTRDDYDINKNGTEAGLKRNCQYGTGHCPANKNSQNASESKISDTISEAVQTMMKHDELLQQKHHLWMEKQFEIQRKHDEDQRKMIVNELKELRSVITVLLTNKQPHANNQNR